MLQRIQMNRLLMVIVSSSFLLNLAFGLYRSIFTNFAGQELGLSSTEFGWLEGIREIPGLLTVFIVALASRLNDGGSTPSAAA